MSDDYGAPSLRSIAKRACIKSIHLLTDVADLPYDLVKPVLAKLQTPKQLSQIETNSPQICGLDEELWLKFIERDIPNWRNKPHRPKNPKNWYKVYLKLIQDNMKEVEEDAAVMEAALQGIKAEQAKRTSKFIDNKSAPPLPRMGGMRIEKSRGGFVKQNNTAVLTFNSGSKTKSLVERARREAREKSHFSHRNATLAKPTHELNAKASTIRQAPKGILNDHIKHEPKNLSLKPSPEKKSYAGTSSAASGFSKREERKRKLEELTSEEDEKPEPPKNEGDTLSPQASHARINRKVMTASPDGKPKMVGRPKAPVDIFMPVKKRKVVR